MEDWIVPVRMIENAPDFTHLGEIFRAEDRPTAVVSMDDPLSIGLSGFLLTLGAALKKHAIVPALAASGCVWLLLSVCAILLWNRAKAA